MMSVFATFEAFCVRHDLRFWIDWGTLLGALRHGGIIPWDYDMDVCMHKDDYERLLHLFGDLSGIAQTLPTWQTRMLSTHAAF